MASPPMRRPMQERLDQDPKLVPQREQRRLVFLDGGEAAERLEEVVVGEIVVDLRDLGGEDGAAAGLAIEAVAEAAGDGGALAGHQADRLAGREPVLDAV